MFEVTPEMIKTGTKALFAYENNGADLDEIPSDRVKYSYSEKVVAILKAIFPPVQEIVLPEDMTFEIESSIWGGYSYWVRDTTGKFVGTGTCSTYEQAEEGVLRIANRWVGTGGHS